MAPIDVWQKQNNQRAPAKLAKKSRVRKYFNAIAILLFTGTAYNVINHLNDPSGPNIPPDTNPIIEPSMQEPPPLPTAPEPAPEPITPEAEPLPEPEPEPELVPAPELEEIEQPIVTPQPDGFPPLPRTRPEHASLFGNVETIMTDEDRAWREAMPKSFERPQWLHGPRVAVLDAPLDSHGNIDTRRMYSEGDIIINTAQGDRSVRLILQDEECMATLSAGQRCVIEYPLVAIGKDGLGITPNLGEDGRGTHYQMFTESLERSGETAATNTSGAWPYYKPRAEKATVLGARAAWLVAYGEQTAGTPALHGTSNSFIDPNNMEVSLGCYRMNNSDIIDLFARVLDVDNGLLDADIISATNVFILEDAQFTDRIIKLDGYAAMPPAYQDDTTKRERLSERKNERLAQLAATPAPTATQTADNIPPMPRPRPNRGPTPTNM